MIITYMYWNNPIQEYTWPNTADPVAESLHSGRHFLFYDPAFDQSVIEYYQKLVDLCRWANDGIQQGIDQFLQNPQNHYDIANLVKLNIWIDDIRRQGIVKPMLVIYAGKYTAATGESRLRTLERLPDIKTVRAFVNTTGEYQDQFTHLEPVTTFDQFARLCQAVDGQNFLFRLTDETAPYGIDWYEYNSCQTVAVTPGQEYCVEVVANYLHQHPATVITPEWFDQLVDWASYKNS